MNQSNFYLVPYLDKGLLLSKNKELLEGILTDLKNFSVTTASPENYVGMLVSFNS